MPKLQLVVADTGPLNYLALIGCAHVLGELFGSVAVPQAVYAELLNLGSPEAVRGWVLDAPGWLQVYPRNEGEDNQLLNLDAGERGAILLAEKLQADLLLIDERAGRLEAERRGLKVTGHWEFWISVQSEG